MKQQIIFERKEFLENLDTMRGCMLVELEKHLSIKFRPDILNELIQYLKEIQEEIFDLKIS